MDFLGTGKEIWKKLHPTFADGCKLGKILGLIFYTVFWFGSNT
jgi:hypothetical protein